MPSEPKPLLPIGLELLLYFLAFLLVAMPLYGLFQLPFQSIAESNSVYYVTGKQLANYMPLLLSAVACAVFFLRKVAFRPVTELGYSIRGKGKDCLAGFLFAFVFYAVAFGVSLWAGVIEIWVIQIDIVPLIASLLVFFVAAAFEEVLMRGYIQGRLMSRMNKYAALAITSVLFALLHLQNPGISVPSLFNLFLAGCLLGASYMYTRNLWFPIFLHTFWNWIQGPVLGYEVSGTRLFPSFIELYLPDENVFNGGSFGFEGSIICTMMTIIATALIMGYYEGKKPL